MPVEILPIANDDVMQALAYIATDDPDAADRLLDEIMRALDQASRFPYGAPEVAVGVRRPRHYYRMYVHPYNIYYRIIHETIVVMRVLHERMDSPRHLP